MAVVLPSGVLPVPGSSNSHVQAMGEESRSYIFEDVVDEEAVEVLDGEVF